MLLDPGILVIAQVLKVTLIEFTIPIVFFTYNALSQTREFSIFVCLPFSTILCNDYHMHTSNLIIVIYSAMIILFECTLFLSLWCMFTSTQLLLISTMLFYYRLTNKKSSFFLSMSRLHFDQVLLQTI